jgi:hypothetical protein
MDEASRRYADPRPRVKVAGDIVRSNREVLTLYFLAGLPRVKNTLYRLAARPG